MAVELDEQLLEILACPSPDHAPLRVGTPDDPDAPALTCTSCGREFPVVDGVPVLLLDEAVLPGGAPGAVGERTPGESAAGEGAPDGGAAGEGAAGGGAAGEGAPDGGASGQDGPPDGPSNGQ